MRPALLLLSAVPAVAVACTGGQTSSPPVAGRDAGSGTPPAIDAAARFDASSAIDASASLDASPADAGGYAHVPPPDAGPIDPNLAGDRWVAHWIDDVRPYWIAPEALGVPEGNFPTWRGMDGSLQGSTDRRPRMIGRQIYAYAMGYLMTKETRLLELAGAGIRWLLAHAKDTAHGGYHALLDAQGNPNGDPKLAQDTAYVMLGFAAYDFVTRDPNAEAELLATRDLLFDPTKYWDPTHNRIKDGMTADLSAEYDVDMDGGWELVAQLDAINAFLLLCQPILRDPARRDQFLGDLRTLGHTLIDSFYQDGIFWGVSNKKGQYGGKHDDFGHTLKSYWMLLQIDKRLPDHPFGAFVAANVHRFVQMAYDADNGLWARRPLGPNMVEYGSDWWIYAEADQVAKTLDLIDYRYLPYLARTAGGWLEHYVDTALPEREIIAGVDRAGNRVYGWPVTDTSKCNDWKNGFHSTEHALVSFIAGKNLESAPVTLHFAVPDADAASFVATPYTFLGREIDRTPGATIDIGGAALREVAVRFDGIY